MRPRAVLADTVIFRKMRRPTVVATPRWPPRRRP